MARSTRVLVTAAVAVLAIAALLIAVLREETPEGAADGGTETISETGTTPSMAAPGSIRPDAGSTQGQAPGSGALVQAKWGSGLGQLGRDRPQEGNPEAPMSLAAGPRGELLILDQVNGRLARYGADGKPIGSTPLTLQAAQDLAVAADGTTVVLDRLADKSVAILDPSGKLIGELPVEGKGIDEGGAVTGVFVDGDQVYLEREHAELVKIGDTKGKADPERPTIPGRPTRDGLSFIRAGLIEPAAGRVYVTSIARATLEHRFTRELRAGAPLVGIVLLDTDRAGIIYLGLLAELPTGKPEPPAAPAVLLFCLDPLDGRPLGKAELPASEMPEETFRELVVLDMGGVLYSHRTEAGVDVRRYDCR